MRPRNDWRAGYIERCTSGSEGGSRKPVGAIQQGGRLLPYKTSTTVNLGAALSRAGHSVLLVDMDPQASLTEYFINPGELTATIYNALKDGMTVSLFHIGASISLIPANIDLAAAEIELPAKHKYTHHQRLARVLRSYAADYCLVDCPPSLGELTVNALAAAQYALIPVSTELMAERTVKLILQTIEEIRDDGLNAVLQVWRILPTLYDIRLAHHQEIREALRAKYGNLLYPDPVRATTKYKDAVTIHADVSALDPRLGEYWDTLAFLLRTETSEVQ
jgi:chromosome partitioning protein